MEIEDFEDNIISEIKKIDGVRDAWVDDYNSESLAMFIETEEKANLKKVTPAIKKALKQNGITENLIENWIPPTPKDRRGDREDCSYSINIAYVYADTPSKDLVSENEDPNRVLVFAKYKDGVVDTPYKSKELGDIFVDSYKKKNFSSEDEHIEWLNNKYPNVDIYPLYIYDHSGQIFQETRTDRWDSSFVGAVAIPTESTVTMEDVITELNEWLNGPDEDIGEYEEVGISSLLEDDIPEEEMDASTGIRLH